MEMQAVAGPLSRPAAPPTASDAVVAEPIAKAPATDLSFRAAVKSSTIDEEA